jgi:hypothetical protein
MLVLTSVNVSLSIAASRTRLCFFQDGDIGVGVFPEGEEVFVRVECASAGEVAVGRRDVAWVPHPFARFWRRVGNRGSDNVGGAERRRVLRLDDRLIETDMGEVAVERLPQTG